MYTVITIISNSVTIGTITEVEETFFTKESNAIKFYNSKFKSCCKHLAVVDCNMKLFLLNGLRVISSFIATSKKLNFKNL